MSGISLGRQEAAGGSEAAIRNPAAQTGDASKPEELTEAGAQQAEGKVEVGEGDKQSGAEKEGWKKELEKAGLTVLKGALALGLALGAIPIAWRCFTGPPRTAWFPFDDTFESWPDALKASSRLASGGAVAVGTLTATVLLFDSMGGDSYASPENASQTRKPKCKK
ncbi:hypothetical protein KFL_000840130 [Klebsormidium nitens]|uniref:Uncharacterized protein n=1 Tax=Klebsormidium nitens TaxID=105231 RepID=A0A1Y1HSG2_KLENI|nr:hypothetical protein KFL_000840130 [Klebsormidium nitens]|eukprot:GAQ81570.1 hypothetical protein KFL_000840130 [Klebsormidium nitens]